MPKYFIHENISWLFVYTKITPKYSSSNNDHLFILMILWVDQVVLKLLLVLGTRYLKMESPNGHWMLAADWKFNLGSHRFQFSNMSPSFWAVCAYSEGDMWAPKSILGRKCRTCGSLKIQPLKLHSIASTIYHLSKYFKRSAHIPRKKKYTPSFDGPSYISK